MKHRGEEGLVVAEVLDLVLKLALDGRLTLRVVRQLGPVSRQVDRLREVRRGR